MANMPRRHANDSTIKRAATISRFVNSVNDSGGGDSDSLIVGRSISTDADRADADSPSKDRHAALRIVESTSTENSLKSVKGRHWSKGS